MLAPVRWKQWDEDKIGIVLICGRMTLRLRQNTGVAAAVTATRGYKIVFVSPAATARAVPALPVRLILNECAHCMHALQCMMHAQLYMSYL